MDSLKYDYSNHKIRDYSNHKIMDYIHSMERMERGDYPTSGCGFIKDMVYHHQIAVEMADVIIKYTNNPQILVLARDIIWSQKSEIAQMRKLQMSYFYESRLLSNNNSNSQLDLYYSTTFPCDNCSIYNPNYGRVVRDSDYYESMINMMNKKFSRTDCEFMKEMIIHHQIAVEMASVMNKHTRNPALLNLCRDIIWSQTLEISLMKRLLRSYDSTRFSQNDCVWEYEGPALSCYDPYWSTSQNVAEDKCLIK